jgi:hypothetical protein
MGLALPKEMAEAIGIGQTFPHFRLFGFYLRAVIVIVWQSVGGVYQDRRSVTHFVFSQGMEISGISEGKNKTGKKTAKRVLRVELLCLYFVRTYNKFSVNCLLNFSLDGTPF